MNDLMATLFAHLHIEPTSDAFELITPVQAGKMISSLEDLQSEVVRAIAAIVDRSDNNSVIVARASAELSSRGLCAKVFSVNHLNDFLWQFRDSVASLENVLSEIALERTALNEQDVSTVLNLKDKIRDEMKDMPDFRDEIPDHSGKSRPTTDDNKHFQPWQNEGMQTDRPKKDRLMLEDPRAEAEHIETGV